MARVACPETRPCRARCVFGKTITLAETAIIKVRTRKLTVVDINDEIIHQSDFDLSRELR